MATSSRRATISSKAIPLRTISLPSRASRSWPSSLTNEIQEVYRLQGVHINDKHIEAIVRQAAEGRDRRDRRNRAAESEQIDKTELDEINAQAPSPKARSRHSGHPVLLGITKASLQTRRSSRRRRSRRPRACSPKLPSMARRDTLEGLKENVIVGRLIPAGTGAMMDELREVAIKRDALILEEREKDAANAASAAEAAAAPALPAAERASRSHDLKGRPRGGLFAGGSSCPASAGCEPRGTERAHHRIPYGARMRVEDGNKIKRGERIAEWNPYTRPILTEVEGSIAFEDLVDGLSMSEALDESTGIAKRVVIDWRTGSSRNQHDLRPAIVIKSGNKLLKLARGGDARYILAVDAIISVDPGAPCEGGRRDRAYSDRKRQDARHHRRSAAGGGAVRGAQAEGCGDHRRDRRHGALRQGLQEQAPPHARADRQGRRAEGIPDPEGQAHPSAGWRRHREGRLHRRRQSRPARYSRHQGRRGARRLPGRTKSRRSTGCRASTSTTSTSR